MKKLYYGFCLIAFLVLLGTCFSPWQGDGGTLTINWGKSPSRAAGYNDFVQKAALGMYTFTVDLIGPGNPVTLKLGTGASSASFTLAPGLWNIRVTGAPPIPIKGLGQGKPVMGFDQVQILPGTSTAKAFELYTVTMVDRWDPSQPGKLGALLEEINNGGLYGNDATTVFSGGAPRAELILLASDAPIERTAGLTIDRPVILVASSPVTIKRGVNSAPIFTIHGAVTKGYRPSLSLGLPGMAAFGGSITLDGGGSGIAAIVNVGSSSPSPAANGRLFMYDGVTIQNNYNPSTNGGGVYVTEYSAITMYGGTIQGNSVGTSTSSFSGGGVYVDGGGSFTGTGGIITNNEVITGPPTPGKGGGVYVSSGATYINNGTVIKGNYVRFTSPRKSFDNDVAFE